MSCGNDTAIAEAHGVPNTSPFHSTRKRRWMRPSRAEVVYRPFETLLVPDPWFRGRVVIIGDAAHTTTAHLGQGAGMPLEDAVVLSELLEQDAPLEELLTRFMLRRFERCRYIVEESVRVGEFEMTRQPPDFNHGTAVASMLELTARPI